MRYARILVKSVMGASASARRAVIGVQELLHYGVMGVCARAGGRFSDLNRVLGFFGNVKEL